MNKNMLFLSVCVLVLGACSESSSRLVDDSQATGAQVIDGDTSQERYSTEGSAPSGEKNFKLHLVDAPKEILTNVMVKIKTAELLLEKGGKRVRVPMESGSGLVDLLNLQNGLSLNMGELGIQDGVRVEMMRLILEDEGHYAVKKGGAICELKTPSANKSGLKVKLSDGILIQKNSKYSLVIDFDVKKSVVVLGNGGCLLKPVLLARSLSKVEDEVTTDISDTVVPPESPVDNSGSVTDTGSTDSTGSTGSTDTSTADGSGTAAEGTTSGSADTDSSTSTDPTDTSTGSQDVINGDMSDLEGFPLIGTDDIGFIY